MRLPGGRFASSISRLSKQGVIPQRGDGEPVVPAIYQSIILLQGPRNVGNQHVADDTSHDVISESRLGAQGATNTDSGVFNRGLWHLTGDGIVQFTGTNNVAAFADLQLLSPASAADILFRAAFVTLTNASFRIDTWLNLPSDGWLFRWGNSATVALDVFACSFAFQMAKVL